MTKSVVSVAAIVGYNRCPTLRHRIKEAFGCILEEQQSMWLQHIGKVDLVLWWVVYPGPVIAQAWATLFD
ncbi:hypothetical protein TNCV_4046231 [Trichonephila clavipes]|nr:hypothetical protein TNCV_4046231 [Trichonephila clavipes]